jgi:hypothetical protein
MEERCPIPETVVARVHLKSMGKDEMNLVEFPLTTLADRAPRGCKTLVFEDRILDRGCNQERVRRLTVSASDKYGLPTAIDDEVILGFCPPAGTERRKSRALVASQRTGCGRKQRE